MTLKGIRHLARMITKDSEGDGDSRAPFPAETPASPSPPPAPSSEAGGRDAAEDDSSTPWPVDMAAPSFMILAVRPRREGES
ncbi:hypothetical protein ABZY44_30650 [Streptomyces sp. NPDC006544]|uniref:hypothetical protein n=1 Tax=Streptomyces sp. NPDC006544 TaxID=3154583 RepID=UPI0033AF4F62